jgi:hypothetical protein
MNVVTIHEGSRRDQPGTGADIGGADHNRRGEQHYRATRLLRRSHPMTLNVYKTMAWSAVDEQKSGFFADVLPTR